MRIPRYVISLVLCSVSWQPAAAGNLVKVWELDLSKWNKTTGGNADKFPVAALSFLPDGKQIAITGTEAQDGGGKLVGLVLVISVGGTAGDVKSFDADPMSAFLRWSPSGDAILVNDLLIGLDRGAVCKMPNTGWFISENELVGYKHEGPSHTATRFTTFDKTCHPVKAWETSVRWNILDASAERHLLLVNRFLNENQLVDPGDGHVVRRWPGGGAPGSLGPGGEFADRGTALCEPVDVEKDTGAEMRCWKTDTGELIGNSSTHDATAPYAVSMSSTRVVFSEAGRVPAPIPDMGTYSYKDAVVWDFATGERLASWRPRTQTWMELGWHLQKKVVEPSKFAISADGRFVAEGGDGRIIVCRVDP